MKPHSYLVDHGRLLVSLAKSLDASSGSLAASLRDICQSAAQALRVDRASVWLFGENRGVMVCRHIYDRLGDPPHGGGGELFQADYPRYFQSLEGERVIAAVDASHHPATAEFAAGYLDTYGIASLLDAPVRLEGRMIGVVCHESRERRDWHQDESGFAASVGDLVAQAIAADERRRLQEDLTRSQKLDVVGQLSSGLAHDLNNVLAPIRGYAELNLLRGGVDDRLASDLKNILRAVERGQELVARILRFGRSGQHGGARQSAPALVDLSAVAKEAALLLRVGWPPQIALVEESQVGVHTTGVGTDLQQLLLNLCLNAADAIGTHPGVVEIHTRRLEAGDPRLGEHAARFPAGAAMIEVSDDGPGIPPEQQADVFEPFFTTKPEGTGTGLGLAMCRRIVTEADGEIILESDPGRGTTFRVLLPVASGPRSGARANPIQRSRDVTICVVDDEGAVVDLTERYFEGAGYDVLGTTDPRTAAQLLDDLGSDLDVLIVDQEMNGISGFQLARKAKATSPRVVVILITGKPVDRREPHAWAVDLVLGKPVSLKKLEQLIVEALEARARDDA